MGTIPILHSLALILPPLHPVFLQLFVSDYWEMLAHT
jgi:hypothetical protein